MERVRDESDLGLLCGVGRGGQNRGPGPGGWWVLLQGQEDRNWSRYQRVSAEFRSGHVTFKALVKPSNAATKEVDGTVG